MLAGPMRTWSLALSVLAAAVSLAGCGGDDTGATSGSTTGGSTAPQGAVSVEVYRNDQQTCPYDSLLLEIGNVKASPPKLVVDGEAGAAITCSVAPMGEAFAANGSLGIGKKALSFGDVLTDGGSAVGSIRFQDPDTGAGFASAAAEPCVFQFAPSSDQGVAPGRVFVQFDCPALVSEADPTVVCSSRYGYVLVDRCDAGPSM